MSSVNRIPLIILLSSLTGCSTQLTMNKEVKDLDGNVTQIEFTYSSNKWQDVAAMVKTPEGLDVEVGAQQAFTPEQAQLLFRMLSGGGL